MSSYVEETLTKGETVLLRGKIALQKYWLNYLLALPFILSGSAAIAFRPNSPDEKVSLFLSLFYFALVAMLLAAPIVRFLTNELALTNKRVIAKYGVVSLEAVEIKLEKIESIIVKQGIFGKLLGYGTIVVTGTGATHAIFPAIANPVIFKRQFTSALEEMSGTTA